MGERAREVSGERACFDTVSLSAAAEHIACNVRASGRAEEEDGRTRACGSESFGPQTTAERSEGERLRAALRLDLMNNDLMRWQFISGETRRDELYVR